MNDFDSITVDHQQKFYKGEKITFEKIPPWYKRLWRWLRGIKDPVYEVTGIDYANSEITITLKPGAK